MNLQVANFQICKHVFTYPAIEVSHMSGMYCHVCASSTSAFVYFTIQHWASQAAQW